MEPMVRTATVIGIVGAIVTYIMIVLVYNHTRGRDMPLSEQEYLKRIEKELAYLDRGANCSPTAETYIPSLSARGRAFLEIDRIDLARAAAIRCGKAADPVKRN